MPSGTTLEHADTHTSRYDHDDRRIASSDKPSAQRTRQVVTSFGGAPNDQEIGLAGVGNPQELFGDIAHRMDERHVDTVVMAVPAHLTAQFLRLITYGLLNGPVGDDRAAKGGRSRGGAAGDRTHEDGDRSSTKALRFATRPAEGVPRRI